MLQTKIVDNLSKLPESIQEEVLHYVEFLVERYAQKINEEDVIKPKRKAGALKGTFVLPLPDYFDEPLEDFKEYM
ncbi:MAG: DUF2281 domain-containing protein [Hormoscilla sp.]